MLSRERPLRSDVHMIKAAVAAAGMCLLCDDVPCCAADRLLALTLLYRAVLSWCRKSLPGISILASAITTKTLKKTH